MPKLSPFDKTLLEQTLRKQQGIVSRRQATACAMTPKAISHRIRPDGPWQTVLPGIYVNGGGRLTDAQRAVAAFLYAGRAIAITGSAALSWHAMPVKRGDFVDVLVPLHNKRCDAGFVRLRRTTIMPGVFYRDGVVSYVPVDRAIADAARRLTDMSEIRDLVALSVQRGEVEIWQLQREVEAGQVAGTARLRVALAEVAEGVRSSAEADLRSIIKQSRLPTPMYNPRLLIDKEFLAMPDAWWPEAGVAAEVDSRAWHLSPRDWERTLARHDRMTAHGILVLHFPPRRLRQAPREVGREIGAALAASKGPIPSIVTIPAT